MAQNLPWTAAYFNANIAGMVVGNLTPYQVAQLQNMLNGMKNYRLPDSAAGVGEQPLSIIFGAGLNP